MAETLVEKNVCKECGADVRPQTAFCYNCGKAVAQPEEAADPIDEASDVWFGETIVNEEPIPDVEGPVGKEDDGSVPSEAQSVPEEAKTLPMVDEIDPLHHSLPVESGLKSAAEIRRKPKTFKGRDVEVVWEGYKDPPTRGLILITLLLVLFTIIVFLIAMQMK